MKKTQTNESSTTAKENDEKEDILLNKVVLKKSKQFGDLESAFQPILRTFLQFSTELASRFGAPELLKGADGLIAETTKSLELYCYDLMRVCLEFVLSGTSSINVKEESFKIKKFRAQLYISKLKKYFLASKNPQLRLLVQKLVTLEKSSMMNYLANDSDDEGFFDEENQQLKNEQQQFQDSFQIRNSITQSFGVKNDSIITSDKNASFSELCQKVKELEDAAKQREDYLNGLTTGYMKDISHMKEMYFRKTNVDAAQFYEVQYFDVSGGLDEVTKNSLNDKLRALKQQFEETTKDLSKKCFFVAGENDRLKKQISQLLAAQGDSVEMLKRVFSIQENPYMLWKIIQELKGNRFFFDVFEVQRPEFGINYKEVNAMLMSKRAYEREYSGYKEQVDNQLVSLIGRCRAEIEDIRDELSQKEDDFMKLSGQQKENTEARTAELIVRMNDVLQQNLQIERDRWMKERNDMIEECQERERVQVRDCFFRWKCVQQLMKAKESESASEESFKGNLKAILCGTGMANERVLLAEKKLHNIEEEMKNQTEKITEIESRLLISKKDQEEITTERILKQAELFQMKEQLAKIKQTNRKNESKAIMYKRVISNIREALQIKLDDANFESLDDEEEKLSSLKNLQKKIDARGLRTVREEILIGDKVDEVQQELHAETTKKLTKGTITELLNINMELGYCKRDGQGGGENKDGQDGSEIRISSCRSLNPEIQMKGSSGMDEGGLEEDQEKIKVDQETQTEYVEINEGNNNNTGNNNNNNKHRGSQSPNYSSHNSPLLQPNNNTPKLAANTPYLTADTQAIIARANSTWSALKSLDPANQLNSKGNKRASQVIQDDRALLNGKQEKSKQVKKKSRVFDRLYEDSREKANRLQYLKAHLESIEQFHWEEVLSILNLYSRHDPLDAEHSEELLRIGSQHNRNMPQSNRGSNWMNNSQEKYPENSQQDSMKQQISKAKQYEDGNSNMRAEMISTYTSSPPGSRGLSRAEYYFRKTTHSCYNNSPTSNSSINSPTGVFPKKSRKFEQFEALDSDRFGNLRSSQQAYVESFQSGFRRHSNKIRRLETTDTNPKSETEGIEQTSAVGNSTIKKNFLTMESQQPKYKKQKHLPLGFQTQNSFNPSKNSKNTSKFEFYATNQEDSSISQLQQQRKSLQDERNSIKNNSRRRKRRIVSATDERSSSENKNFNINSDFFEEDKNNQHIEKLKIQKDSSALKASANSRIRCQTANESSRVQKLRKSQLNSEKQSEQNALNSNTPMSIFKSGSIYQFLSTPLKKISTQDIEFNQL